MRLVAVIPKEDLVSLVEALTPMRLVIDGRQGRTVTLGRPNLIELVPERGLRIRGDARIMWGVAKMPISITVDEWQMLLVPRVVARKSGRVLELEPMVEQLDLKRVPGFIDDRIAGALRDGLDAQREKLAWHFARTLTKRLMLPLAVGPARHFEIAALDAKLSVSETEMRLAVSFEARIQKERVAATEADMPSSAVTRPPESRRVAGDLERPPAARSSSSDRRPSPPRIR